MAIDIVLVADVVAHELFFGVLCDLSFVVYRPAV